MLFVATAAARFVSSSFAFSSHNKHTILRYTMSDNKEPETKKAKTMATITEGVEFDTIAREWRCKWSADNDKKSLQEAQKALNGVLEDIKKIDGVKGVQRVVCGGCLDYKVITSLPADKFGAWEEQNKFAPEEDFLAKLKAIDGISQVETQTYTLMPMM